MDGVTPYENVPPEPVFTMTSCVGEGWPHCCWSISTDWFAAPVEIAPESSVEVP